MAAPKGDLKDRLSRYSEIDLSVTGRKSGRTISQPVWFVFDGDRLYLLPVRGSDTQWYKNVLKNPVIRVAARDAEAEFHAVRIPHQVRGWGCEEVLFEVGCGRGRADGVI